MTLPASGTISMSQVSVELGRASTYASNLGESAVRTLAGVPSGTISFSNLHGKSSFPAINDPMASLGGGIFSTIGFDSNTNYFNVRRNGTWDSSGYSGNWAVSPVSTSGDAPVYVRFTRTAYTPSGGSCDVSTSWLALTTDRSIWISGDFTGGGGSGTSTSSWTIELAEYTGGSYVVRSTSYIQLHAEWYE